MAVITLVLRRTSPVALIVIEFCELFLVMIIGIDPFSYMQLPLFLCLYLCVRLPSYPQAVCDAVAVGVVAVSCLYPMADFGTYFSFMLFLAAAVALASSVYRIWRERRDSALAVQNLQEESHQLSEQRNRAVTRSRMAAELHDSVGHGLTVIIAFSQGLQDLLQRRGQIDDDVAVALDGIEAIARESLESTRQMLSRLHAADSTSDEMRDSCPIKPSTNPSVERNRGHLHDWDDAQAIFHRVRALGIILVFTETGNRSRDPGQADLCFRVTRECITNALRHANDVSRISVAWDHRAADMTVIVRNDGVPADNTNEGKISGTGLHALDSALRSRGGTLAYGANDSQWDVTAMIPVKSERSKDQ